MKKFLTFILLLTLVFLSACVNRYKLFGGLEQIKVYDEEENEVIGKYLDYYRNYEDFFVHLNSPAPRYYFYCVPIEEGSTYTLEFKITVRSNYSFEKIISRDYEYYLTDGEYSLEGKLLTFRITLNELSLVEPYFHIDSLIFSKNLDDSKKFEGTTTITINDRTEKVRGLYFYNDDEVSPENLSNKKRLGL